MKKKITGRLFVCGLMGIFLMSLWQLDVKADSGSQTANSNAQYSSDETNMKKVWLASWEKGLLSDGGVSSTGARYCDTENGEEICWLVSPYLNAYYYGYVATHDPKWVDRFVDWTDSLIKRGVKEPDGYIGWPKIDDTGDLLIPNLYSDSELGEAMGFRPIVLMSYIILKTPSLKLKYGDKAREYIRLSEQIYQKWDQRGAWREVKDGGVWVVPQYGFDPKTNQWTEGYAHRFSNDYSFTLQDNKQNGIVDWLIAMYDVTKKPIYRERAKKWWQVMASRMKLRDDGKYYVWNYWEPAGPWDYKPDGSTKMWVGVHPNGGYYGIDVSSIVNAYEHHLVFDRTVIDRLIATNRDFMWNQQVNDPHFQRIDGEAPDSRWAKEPGVLWGALVPYDASLRKVFEANLNPSGWDYTSAVWYVALQEGRLKVND